MSKLFAIIRREFIERVRTKAFVIGTLMGPVLFFAIGALPGMILGKPTASQTIAVVDANVRYPGLPELAHGQATDSKESVFSTRWLHGSLALLSAPKVEHPGEVVPQLARVLLEGSELFAHVLVDLTGFELLGEHGSAAACMDGVALVATAHETREQELLALTPLMPPDRFLGILLVG